MGTQTSISAGLWEGAAFYVAVQAYVSGKSSGYSNIEYFIIQNQTEPEFTVMTNPTDSQILSVRGSDGTTIHYYGDRDENGIPTNIDRFLVVEADDTTTEIELDSEDRPKRIVTSEGVTFELSYIGSSQGFVKVVAPDGSLQVNTSFPIETGASNPSPVESMASISANNGTADCLIRVDRCGAGATDASVYVTLSGTVLISGQWPAKHVNDGLYRASLPTSLGPSLTAEDLRKAAENIAGKLGSICTKLSFTGPNTTFLLMGMCPQIAVELAPFTGPGAVAIATGCTTAIAAVAAYCKVLGEGGAPGAASLAERIFKGIQDPKNDLPGDINISVDVYYGWARGLGAGFNATATAPSTGPFPTIEVAAPSKVVRITNLTLSPAIPVPLEPYEIITEVACPHDGDYLTIDVVRTDDRKDPTEYHFQFPPFYGGLTTSLTRKIPAGGDFGAATDTVTATVHTEWFLPNFTKTTKIKIPSAVLTINGTWTGTFTMTDYEITDEAAAKEEGCTLAIAEKIVGYPFPMTIEITNVDPSTGQGTATMLIDVSSLEGAKSEPQSFTVIQNGSAVTFESTGTDAYTMNATVTSEGTNLTMTGTTSVEGVGWKMNCAFTASKPQ